MRNDNDWVLLRLYLLIIHFMKKILFSPPDMSEAEINGVCDALNSMQAVAEFKHTALSVWQ